jgi:hypothetical protein
VDPLPGAVLTPSPEVMVDGLPGREVVRKQTPLAATTRDVEDGVEDLAVRGAAWDARGLWGWGDGALCRTTRHRKGRFGMLFSCSVIYRATLSRHLFGQSQKKHSANFALTELCEVRLFSILGSTHRPGPTPMSTSGSDRPQRGEQTLGAMGLGPAHNRSCAEP